MGIKTKAELAAYFETGDKPTQAQFGDLIDTVVAQPSGMSYPAIIEAESTASSTSRGIGAFGVVMLNAGTTAAAVSLLGVPDSFSTVGKALASAATTAAAQALLNVPTHASQAVDWITGQIDSPASARYVLDQYAPVAYTVDWIAAKLSAGSCGITGQIDGTNITGIVSAVQGAAEVISSAAGANAVAVGNTVRLVVTGGSSPASLSFTMKVTRT